MPETFAFIPTGETRPPRKGEWFNWPEDFDQHSPVRAAEDFILRDLPIYRRISWTEHQAVVQALVEALEIAKCIIEQETSFGTKDYCDALAAAREHGIGVEPKEPTP